MEKGWSGVEREGGGKDHTNIQPHWLRKVMFSASMASSNLSLNGELKLQPQWLRKDHTNIQPTYIYTLSLNGEFKPHP